MTYIFTEPSPSTTTYIRSGRGGAGNTFRATDLPSSSSSSSSSSTTTTTKEFTPRRFFSGIGGAGNAHSADQLRPALLRSRDGPSDQNPAVGYCGRGGAGNVYRRKTNDAASVSSEGSDDSAASSVSSMSAKEKAKLWAARVSGSFGRSR